MTHISEKIKFKTVEKKKKTERLIMKSWNLKQQQKPNN